MWREFHVKGRYQQFLFPQIHAQNCIPEPGFEAQVSSQEPFERFDSVELFLLLLGSGVQSRCEGSIALVEDP